MGARTPSTLRPRRGAIKCEYCGRSLANLDALKSHLNTLHASALKRKVKLRIDAKKLTRAVRLPVGKSEKFAPGKVNCNSKKRVLVSKLQKRPNKPVSLSTIVAKSLKKSNTDVTVNKSIAKHQKTVKQSESKPNNIKKVLKNKKASIKTDCASKADKSAVEMKDEVGSSSKGEEKRSTSCIPRPKIKFKCPKCERKFPISFKAQKHIQKFHCVNSDGVIVEPDSPDLIQPIQMEHCSLCNDVYTPTHDCPKAPKPLKQEQEPVLLEEEDTDPETSVVGAYGCNACKKGFDRLSLFQKHVTSMHNDELESMLFPTHDEFESWRDKMETQTKTCYVSAGRNNNKDYYQCSAGSERDMVLSCPSLIVYQTYPRGIQVHFYKRHYKHDCKPYCMEDTYKNYTISDMMLVEPVPPVTPPVRVKKEELSDDIEELKNDDDLYVKFKTLMENIISDAVKINIDTLKILSNKALEMQSLLNQYDEDDDPIIDNTSMLFNSQHSEKKCVTKRKCEASITDPMRKKLRWDLKKSQEHTSPVLQHINKRAVNTFSLADNKDSDKILQELEVKPEIDTENADDDINSKEPRSKSPKLFKKLMPQIDRSPSAFNNSYKDFVSSVICSSEKKQKLSKNNSSEKKIKTKMGQFNPNSPKRMLLNSNKGSSEDGPPKQNTAKGGPKSKRKKTVRDFKYEVKERDNDCNILILKI